MQFVEDQSVHTYHRATNKDYQGSGYDRGHMAAAANHRQSVNAMKQTFTLSNTAPQVRSCRDAACSLYNKFALQNFDSILR